MKNRTAATKTLYVLEHHAKPLKELAFYLFTLAAMHNFRVESQRGGANSWTLMHPTNGKSWYVRGRFSPWRIEIGSVQFTSRAALVRWFDNAL